MTTAATTRLDAVTERLFGLLPAHIRSVDLANGSPLKAYFRVLAGASADIDRVIDTLYASMFVETAPEDALADLAAIVASESLRPLPKDAGFSARAFVANTVRYRRGKGTARVLELLAADVCGFGAVAVEYFQRLARLQHLADVRPERPATARLVDGGTAARAATARDVLPRLVDLRSIARAAGRHHVPHVGVHVLRPVVPVFPGPDEKVDVDATVLAGVPVARPWSDGGVEHAGYFQLSAQPGRTLRLFNPDRRSESDAPRVLETELRDRLRRLPLHLETEELRHAALEGRAAELPEHPWFDDAGNPFALFLRAAGASTFVRVEPADILIANLEALPTPAGVRPAATRSHQWFTAGEAAAESHTASHAIRCAFDPVAGRLIIAEPGAGEADVEEVRVSFGTGIAWEIGAGPQERNDDDLPFDVTDSGDVVHFVRIVDATQPESGDPVANVRPVASLATALSEWSASGAGKRGLIVLVRCDREGAVAPATEIEVAVHPQSELHIVSAQWRPKVVKPGVPDDPSRHGYLVRRERRFTVDAPLRVSAGAPPSSEQRAGGLVLDGLELTAGLSLEEAALSSLLIRHCTVRSPGGTALASAAALEGAEIAIDRSIVGRIDLEAASGIPTGSLVLSDAIVSADGAPGDSIAASAIDAQLRNVTVLGTSGFKSLEATNVIFHEAASVARRQSGCVRYSWIAEGSAMPPRYRCQPDLAIAAAAAEKGAALAAGEAATVALGVKPLFLDTSVDEPTVAMLHPLSDDAIRLGGESDTEMGAWSSTSEGLRASNLASLFDDYLPFGLEAAILDDTHSSAVTLRRDRP